VTVFDRALRDLARDLLETMHAAPGIGITAPHIGISLRVVVLDLDDNEGARTYVNPEIIWASPEMIMHREGSVSMPGSMTTSSVMRASGSAIATSMAMRRAKSPKACAPCATSMRSIS
jgi:peptide deformylase